MLKRMPANKLLFVKLLPGGQMGRNRRLAAR